MTTSLDIRSQDLSIVHAILSAHLPPAAKVHVFGSRINGRARRGSDLDLAIDAGRPLTRTEFLDLEDAFEESNLPYTVDVIDLHKVNETFRQIIVPQMVLLERKVVDSPR